MGTNCDTLIFPVLFKLSVDGLLSGSVSFDRDWMMLLDACINQ